MSRTLFSENQSGATFSPCRTWRYALWRTWDESAGLMGFIGLNPSTADEKVNDPTIRRCIGFAMTRRLGGIIMLNAFAFRATDPDVMKAASDPVGPGNNEAIRDYAAKCCVLVACWGAHGSFLNRHEAIKRILSGQDRPIRCFGLTKGGQPKHPLYLPGTAELVDWWRPNERS